MKKLIKGNDMKRLMLIFTFSVFVAHILPGKEVSKLQSSENLQPHTICEVQEVFSPYEASHIAPSHVFEHFSHIAYIVSINANSKTTAGQRCTKKTVLITYEALNALMEQL